MAGWKIKLGEITEYNVTEDRLWSLFNYVFSDACRKRNTFKFGLIKALLDSSFYGQEQAGGYFYSFDEIFCRFTANYWNLIVKYNLRQMRRDGKSEYSKIEIILRNIMAENAIANLIEFDSVENENKRNIINRVTLECKRYVIGALYNDFDGVIYSFDLKQDGLLLNYCVRDFMQKHKSELERLNYYAWARFLEQINDDNELIRVIDKLELATPRRENLSIYREILYHEFEQDNCFYCGKKLYKNIHVDHFIPWSFVKDDKMWNFVLSCSACNEKKNNRVPINDFLVKIEYRNKKIQLFQNEIIQRDFASYNNDILRRMWNYAKLSGLKEYKG